MKAEKSLPQNRLPQAAAVAAVKTLAAAAVLFRYRLSLSRRGFSKTSVFGKGSVSH
jgi:hypothetical protein